MANVENVFLEKARNFQKQHPSISDARIMMASDFAFHSDMLALADKERRQFLNKHGYDTDLWTETEKQVFNDIQRDIAEHARQKKLSEREEMLSCKILDKPYHAKSAPYDTMLHAYA